MANRQEQSGGERSTNIQAMGDVQVGLSYAEAKQIALDVFDANFYRLSAAAAQTAQQRAEKLIEAYLERLQAEAPAGLEEMRDPDMQYALYTAQREYARQGDDELGDLLVQLLVDRAQRGERGLQQIVLNESLSVAAKLTSDQLDALTLVFVLRYTRRHNLTSLDTLGAYLDGMVLPFVLGASEKQSAYQHLEYAGCGTISIGSTTIERAFRKLYAGLFSGGLSSEKVTDFPEDHRSLLVPCLQDPDKLQIGVTDGETLDKLLQERGATPEATAFVKQAFEEQTMAEADVRGAVLKVRPGAEALFKKWSDTQMKHLTLTSVGIAIGHANLQRKTGEKLDLSLWI